MNEQLEARVKAFLAGTGLCNGLAVGQIASCSELWSVLFGVVGALLGILLAGYCCGKLSHEMQLREQLDLDRAIASSQLHRHTAIVKMFRAPGSG